MSRRVVVVGDRAAEAEVVAALGGRGIAVDQATFEDLSPAGASAVLFTPADGGTAAEGVARVLQAAKPCPPVVVHLPATDAAQRDQCIIRGAADVAFDAPGQLAERLLTAVEGWTREAERRPLGTTLRAQRGRQPLELKVTDLDATGVGLAAVEGLRPGELLRFVLPMPQGGDLVTWGRVASAGGKPGVRFLALGADDVARVRALVAASPATPPAIPTPLVPRPPPVMAAARPAPPVIAPPPAPEPAPPAPEPAPPDVAEAIATELAPPAPAPASEADVLAGLLNSALERRWPAAPFVSEAAVAVLKPAVAGTPIPETAGAPPPDVVKDFAKTLHGLERRAFEVPGSGETGLLQRLAGLRLRLFALGRDADKRRAEATGGWVIDETALQDLAAEVKATDAELQKSADGHMQRGDPGALRDVTALRNTLNRTHGDLKTAISRLRGDEVQAPASAALLDAGDDVGPATWRRDAPAKEAEKPKEKKKAVSGGADRKGRRGLLVGWSVAMVALLAYAIVSWPRGPHALTPKELAGLDGVQAVLISEAAEAGRAPALVRVQANFKPPPEELKALRGLLKARGVRAMMVVDTTGHELASQRTDLP